LDQAHASNTHRIEINALPSHKPTLPQHYLQFLQLLSNFTKYLKCAYYAVSSVHFGAYAHCVISLSSSPHLIQETVLWQMLYFFLKSLKCIVYLPL
jgi:hypothetical protein